MCRTEPEQGGVGVLVKSAPWLLGIALIGARSIAQEISRCADGCKELVNHSREGQAKLQQRVAVNVVLATAAATVPVVVASQNPRNGPGGTLASLAPDDPLIRWNRIPAPPRCGLQPLSHKMQSQDNCNFIEQMSSTPHLDCGDCLPSLLLLRQARQARALPRVLSRSTGTD